MCTFTPHRKERLAAKREAKEKGKIPSGMEKKEGEEEAPSGGASGKPGVNRAVELAGSK